MKGDFKMDNMKLMAIAMALGELYKNTYTTIYALNLSARDILMQECGMSKEEAENAVVEMNERYQKIVLKAAIEADSERGGA